MNQEDMWDRWEALVLEAGNLTADQLEDLGLTLISEPQEILDAVNEALDFVSQSAAPRTYNQLLLLKADIAHALG